MGFGIDQRATSRKGQGWFRRGPSAREVASRLERMAGRVLGDAVRRSGWVRDRFVVDLQLESFAPRAVLAIEDDASVHLTGETIGLGPGYHCELVRRVTPLLDEIEYAWAEEVDLATVQRAMCTWLAAELTTRERPLRIGIPVHRKFHIDAPLATLTGTRDRAWCDAVVGDDPKRASDVFPWWDDAPGTVSRASALVALWLDVPWREPLDDDERKVMKRVDEDLRAARDANPALALPWRAWSEMLANLGIEDEDVQAHLTGEPEDEIPVGYRRLDLDVDLSGGWSVTLPGSMVGHWEDDGARYWATDGDRVVDFSSLTAAGERDSARLLAIAPEQYPVIATHEDGRCRGRAEGYEAEGVRTVVGLMAVAPHVGILTCKGGDESWALATWRSLRCQP